MSRVQSHTPPDEITLEGKTLYIRWDVSESEIHDEMGDAPPVTQYDYNEVVLQASPDRNRMVRAIIASELEIEDELAIMNNYALYPERYSMEYGRYQSIRTTAKRLADAAMDILTSRT